MGDQAAIENRRFGRYLRLLREQRKLSLDAVEEMSMGYPERITKSHLSRIENGRAVPSFPRMFALSQIYGVPITSVAEKFETDLQIEMKPAALADRTADEIQRELEQHKEAGRYQEALALASAALEGFQTQGDDNGERDFIRELRLYQINSLVHLGRYELAKVECEKLLNNEELSKRQRLWAVISFVTCCYRLRRYTIAQMGLEQADQLLAKGGNFDRLRAIAESLRGPVFVALNRNEQAAEAFTRALEIFLVIPDSFEACKARINLAQALINLGQLKKARNHLTKALKSAQESGYDKLGALALSHLALTAYRLEEPGAAEAYALRSNVIARPREYISIVFRNCFYLRAIAVDKGDEAAVKSNDRTLKAYLSRVEPDLPESIEYRANQVGGAQ
jgi:tetratricopeptide (TPR) repeat protein